MALTLKASSHIRPAYHSTCYGTTIAVTAFTTTYAPSLSSTLVCQNMRARCVSSLGARKSSRGQTIRSLHSSRSNSSGNLTADDTSKLSAPGPQPDMAKTAPLAILPLTNIIRSLFTTSVSSSRFLLPPSLAVMSLLAHTNNPLLMPDRNPLLKVVLKHTFYAQFCAGENAAEVGRTIHSLKKIGFSGVILGYAKEVVLSAEQTKDLHTCGDDAVAKECIEKEITPWADGTLETVRLASAGDFVALKFTGAGRQALYTLSERMPPSEALGAAIDSICKLAVDRGVKLLFDAEQQALQAGIDDWTLQYMRKYNTPERATIYGTYQAYLKATPKNLANHLAVAKKEGFALGVKLVRGAYLGSDPRHLIHDTKADTDACYDGVASALLKREWNSTLVAPAGSDATMPVVNMVLASHNQDSVRKARAIVEGGARGTEVAYAQLQGMADEVSCELVASKPAAGAATVGPSAYKYLVWGSTGECMKYLLRRAHENRDAVQRTRDGRDAMWAELKRRTRAAFGLA